MKGNLLSRKAFVIAAALLVLAVQAAPAGAQNPSERTIQVTGHGEASAKPDRVTISFTAENQADTADACTAQHAAKISKLVDALKAASGANAKINTGDYTLNPATVDLPQGQPTKPEVAQTPWNLSMTEWIETDSLEDLGRAVDAAIAAGASNRIQGSGFQDVPVAPPQPGSTVGNAFTHSSAFAVSRPYGPPVPMKRVAFAQVEIDAEGTSVDECTRKAAEVVRRIEKDIDAKLGGKARLQSWTLNLAQKQPQPPASNWRQPPPPQPQKQVYQASSTITVETAEIDKLGAIVQTGMTTGATRLNNVTFTLSDNSEARKDAIDKASAEAKGKAEELAKSMGVKLGKVLTISTNAVPNPQTIYGRAFEAAVGAGYGIGRGGGFAGRQALPVLPREIGFTADVSVAYAIE